MNPARRLAVRSSRRWVTVPAAERQGIRRTKNMYRHTQAGTLLRCALGLATLASLGIAALAGWHPLAIVLAVVFLVLLLLFHSLTVEVTHRVVALRFGPGLLGRRFPVQEIRESRRVRNRWYYGWGIRWIPHGWLFNVSGLDAVELELRDGRKYRIGTDRPDEFVEAIRRACRKAG